MLNLFSVRNFSLDFVYKLLHTFSKNWMLKNRLRFWPEILQTINFLYCYWHFNNSIKLYRFVWSIKHNSYSMVKLFLSFFSHSYRFDLFFGFERNTQVIVRSGHYGNQPKSYDFSLHSVCTLYCWSFGCWNYWTSVFNDWQ